MDLSQTTPKALTKERKAEMVKMILDEPNTGYRRIAERFGVAYSTVTRVASAHNIRRGVVKDTPAKKPRKDRLPGGGELREGGIIANDEQWRARMQRIG